jgi:hypothetical protein
MRYRNATARHERLAFLLEHLGPRNHIGSRKPSVSAQNQISLMLMDRTHVEFVDIIFIIFSFFTATQRFFCMRLSNHTIDDMPESRLDFMKQRVRKESGLQKLEPESYRSINSDTL